MTFDIHQLDRLEYDEAEEIVDEYWDILTELFCNSPEGQGRAEVDPGVGFWVRRFMYYGHSYLSVPLPQISRRHAQEIVADLFPRKISLHSPDDADDAIPELVAFWEYLKREYALPNADDILRYLRKVEPEFKGIMNDPANFGMAKSFFTMGQEMGFDMTTQEGMNAFMIAYNEAILSKEVEPIRPFGPGGLSPGRQRAPKAKKQARKLVQASRKRNRRKRKKRR